jgi:hypothetical protein
VARPWVMTLAPVETGISVIGSTFLAKTRLVLALFRHDFFGGCAAVFPAAIAITNMANML